MQSEISNKGSATIPGLDQTRKILTVGIREEMSTDIQLEDMKDEKISSVE
jgi:hypothetical protein